MQTFSKEKMLFDDSWLFCLGDQAGAFRNDYDDSAWERIALPHDWSTDRPLSKDNLSGSGGGYAEGGIGWYRKHFDVGHIEKEAVYALLFEGVYMDCSIYLNGVQVGTHGYGYSSFSISLTDNLKEKDNLLAVRVDNSALPNSRWYSGSGIYRDVYLLKRYFVHFDDFGIRCAANGIFPEADTANLEIKSMLVNESDQAVLAAVSYQILDTENNPVASAGLAISLQAGERTDSMCRSDLAHPHLWSVQDPYLYTLKTECRINGICVDQNIMKIGVRTASFDKDRGFLLNGKSEKIKGVCLHHDCGITGAVGPKEVWERRLIALKDMGCNAIRMSHNPPVPSLLDLCDEMGFLVMDEFYDEWMLAKNKNENYYSQSIAFGASQFFARDCQTEVRNMIRRDYNHPSVILWSIGNEIPEQSVIDGDKIAVMLQNICHEEDSSRMVTCACDNIMAYPDIRTRQEFQEALDVVGYNYADRWRERAETFYDEDRQSYPDRRFIGTENIGALSIRGNYELSDLNKFGDYRTATVSHESLWRYVVSRDFVSGEFIWTGIDYLGEAGWPMRGAFCGMLDTAGFKKDTYYYFRSIWNKDQITLHLLPHWNFKGEEGTFKTVIAYTNCQYVNLYLNDRLIGTKGYYECPRYGASKTWNDGWGKNPTTNDLHLSWDVPYEPGVLRAEGYIDGKLAIREQLETTGSPVKLVGRAYKNTVHSGEIAQIELFMEDNAGRKVPDADPLVSCDTEGPGEYLGMDGGDPLDLNSYKEKQRKMFAGALLCEVRATGEGKIKVNFTTDGNLTAAVEIDVVS